MNLLVGLIPLVIFLGFMIGGPLVAAYRIHREQQEEVKRLQVQLDAKPRFADQRREMIREKAATLNENERYAMELILVFGGQSDSQLREKLRERFFGWEGDVGQLLYTKTDWLCRDFEGTWRIKPELKSYVEELF